MHKDWRPEVEKELKRLDNLANKLSKEHPTHPFDYQRGQRMALREILSRGHIYDDIFAVINEEYKKMIDKRRESRMLRNVDFCDGSLAALRWAQKIYYRAL